METRTCSRCQQDKPEADWSPSMWKRASGRWCRSCHGAYQREKYPAEYWQAWHRNRYTPKDGADDSPRDCQVCGESYQPGARTRSWFCSRKCKDAARSARLKAERVAAKPPARACLYCGDSIGPERRSDAVFCTAKCNESAHRLKRTLRRRTNDAGMTGWIRAMIFDRDKWECGICHRKVNSSLRHPDPMAPSLDHIVPVCEGGSNDPANLRLTHLRCNLSRGSRGGNEQLALI